MKINDLQELKPVYVHEDSYSSGDEISLIDLVIVLINQKIMIAAFFIAFTALGVSIALSTQKTYTYSTTIEIGSQILDTSIKHFESPQALLAKLQHIYIPQVLIKHRQSYPNDKNKYQIKTSVPGDSNLALIELVGTEDQEEISKELLKLISQKAIQDHKLIFQSIKQSLEGRLNQVTNNLKSLRISEDNETEIARYQNIIESLSTQLINLRKTTGFLPAIRSLEPIGGGRKIIVIVSAFAGLFLGVFSAFFAEFISKVKQRIDEENKT